MIAKKSNAGNPITIHHCFFPDQQPGCVHLPVAPACNVECRFCPRTFDHVEKTPPAGIATVLTSDEAVESVRQLMHQGERLRSVVICGPGEPLANAATYVVMRQIHWQFPELALGVSTNGLLLQDRAEQVRASGISSLSVTINAFLPETAKKVHSGILYKGRRYRIEDSAELLLDSQWQGTRVALEAGLDVTVSANLIPGINEKELSLIAERAGKLGVHRMNIVPFFPQEQLAHLPAPDPSIVTDMRERCRQWIPQVQ